MRAAHGTIAVLSLFCSLPAQEPAPDAPGSAHGLWREDGVLCGGGPAYRVEFRDGGCTYVPALPDAPSPLPLRLGLEAVERGGRVLARGAATELPSTTTAPESSSATCCAPMA